MKELTKIIDYDMMNELDKHYKNTDKNVDSKEEQRERLSSNNVSARCSSLDLDTNNKSREELLNELADIFIESILWELEHGKQHEESSNILPGIYKGTS